MFFKLFPLAPKTVNILPLPFRRFFGIGIDFLPERYLPVMEFLDLVIFWGEPEKTILPPCSPAPGPISIN